MVLELCFPFFCTLASSDSSSRDIASTITTGNTHNILDNYSLSSISLYHPSPPLVWFWSRAQLSSLRKDRVVLRTLQHYGHSWNISVPLSATTSTWQNVSHFWTKELSEVRCISSARERGNPISKWTYKRITDHLELVLHILFFGECFGHAFLCLILGTPIINRN